VLWSHVKRSYTTAWQMTSQALIIDLRTNVTDKGDARKGKASVFCRASSDSITENAFHEALCSKSSWSDRFPPVETSRAGRLK